MLSVTEASLAYSHVQQALLVEEAHAAMPQQTEKTYLCQRSCSHYQKHMGETALREGKLDFSQ